MENVEVEPEIKVLAEEISRYLTQRTLAADTVEGIARWWIMQQRLTEAKGRISKAMEYLHSQGKVSIRELPDGDILYRSLSPNRCSAIEN